MSAPAKTVVLRKVVRRTHPGKLSSLAFTTEPLPYEGKVVHLLDLDNSDVRSHLRTACLRQVVLYKSGGLYSHFSDANRSFATIHDNQVTCEDCKRIAATVRRRVLAKRRGRCA